jgi:MFS family permease
MAALDIAIVGPALPALQEHYDLSERSIAWVFNTFVLFNLLGLPLMARLSDIFGRRVVYAVDIALFAVGSLVVALAPPFEVVLVGRAIQGLGASGVFPVASAVVGDVIKPAKRGAALGLLGAVFGLAFIIGPILAGILLLIGWPWLFVVNLPLALVVLISGLRVLPSSESDRKKTLDGAGIAVIGLLLASFAFGMNRIDTEQFVRSFLSPTVLPWLAISAVLVPVFISIERRAPNPLVRIQLFRSRQVIIASCLGIGAGLTEAAFVFMPAMAVAAFDISSSTASFMLLPLVTAVAVGSPIGGRLLDRFGSRFVILASTLLLTAGTALMAFPPLSALVFYAGSILIGIGLSGLLGSSLSYILLHEAKHAERTVAQGIVTLSISVGQLTGGALIGAVVASTATDMIGFQLAFGWIAGSAFLLTLLSLGLRKRAVEQVLLREDPQTVDDLPP